MASHEQGGALVRAWRHLERPVRILVYLLIALSVVMLYHQTEYLVVHLFNVLLLFVFAAIIALLLTPVIDRMEALPVFKGRRVVAVILLYLIIIGLVAGVIALVTPALIGQAKQLPALETRAIALVRTLQDAIDNAGIPLQLSLPSATGGISTAVLGSVLGILSGTLGTLINILLVIVISIYLLIEGRQLIASMRKLFPRREQVYDFTLLAVGTTVGQYARGQLIMSFVMGTYTGVAMTLIGVPYAVVLGILTFFLEFLPLIGAPVGMGLAVLIALAFKGPLVGLLALIIALGGRQPKIRRAASLEIGRRGRLDDARNRVLARRAAQDDAGTAGKRHQRSHLRVAGTARAAGDRRRHVAAEDLFELTGDGVSIDHQGGIHVGLVVVHRCASSGSRWAKAFRANLLDRQFHLHQ